MEQQICQKKGCLLYTSEKYEEWSQVRQKYEMMETLMNKALKEIENGEKKQINWCCSLYVRKKWVAKVLYLN